MKAELKLNCEKCIEDITLDITIKGRTMPSFREIRAEAKKQGWHLGRNCYCPDCHRELAAHCITCTKFEGNKTMGAAICLKDGKFTTAEDYCKDHEPMHGYAADNTKYENPIPKLD